MILILRIRTVHPDLIIVMPNHVRVHILPLVLEQGPFFNPPGDFPSLELDHDLVGTDWLSEVEVDMP